MSALMQHRAVQAYRTAAETVTPAQAIVMLYDGAIKQIVSAKVAIEEKRIEDRYNNIVKAHSIINGLHCQLDHAKGGEIAEMLDQYYSYLLQRLTMVNVKNDPDICDEIVARLREMRASWAHIAQANATPRPSKARSGDRQSVTATA